MITEICEQCKEPTPITDIISFGFYVSDNDMGRVKICVACFNKDDKDNGEELEW